MEDARKQHQTDADSAPADFPCQSLADSEGDGAGRSDGDDKQEQ
jgi:hypothetical protein